MILIYNYMKMKNILFILAIILSPIFVYGKGETVYTRLYPSSVLLFQCKHGDY